MKLSFSCLWSQTPDFWCILLCSSFQTAPSTEGAVSSCLFLLLLLICGKTVLEPVVLGTIKHQPSKLHAPRSWRDTPREQRTGTTGSAGVSMTSTYCSRWADPTPSLIPDGPGPWKVLCMCGCCMYSVATEPAGALCSFPPGSTCQGQVVWMHKNVENLPSLPMAFK